MDSFVESLIHTARRHMQIDPLEQTVQVSEVCTTPATSLYVRNLFTGICIMGVLSYQTETSW